MPFDRQRRAAGSTRRRRVPLLLHTFFFACLHGTTNKQRNVRSEVEEVSATIANGFKWLSHPNTSNIMLWNGTEPGKNRIAVLCSMPKVASSTLRMLNYKMLSHKLAAKALLDPDTVRAVVVRSPVDRFLSWHADKIAGGDWHSVSWYNAIFMNRRHSYSKHEALEYARAISQRPQGAWDLEYHLAPMTRLCHLSTWRYDVVGTLNDLPAFWRALEQRNVSLPPTLRSSVSPATVPHINCAAGRGQRARASQTASCHARLYKPSCELYQALEDIYRQDFIWMRKMAALGLMPGGMNALHLEPPENCTVKDTEEEEKRVEFDDASVYRR